MFSPPLCRDSELQVRSQIEVLLEACAGRENLAPFVSAVWKAVANRLEHDFDASNFIETDGEVEKRDAGDGYGGWEETKGDVAAELEEKEDSLTGRRARGRLGDVARAASSDQQLRVAGTFHRAIRASVSEQCSAMVSINTKRVARVFDLQHGMYPVFYGFHNAYSSQHLNSTGRALCAFLL